MAYLIHDAKGLPIKKNAFDSAWQRVMKKAMESGVEVDGQTLKLEERFTFHDLKAAGYSDSDHKFAGHRSRAMHDVYMRKLEEVKATR